MGSMADSWVKDYNEAARAADDISGMISSYFNSPSSGPESLRQAPTIRRKLTILGTRLDGLHSALAKLPSNKFMYESPKRTGEQFFVPPIHENRSSSEKETNRRKDMLSNLRTKVNQMSSTLNASKANRDSLLGPDTKSADTMTRTVGLDNQGLVGLQRQIMKEQDDGLEKLEETVISTKHIALAVNEELDLHVRLIDTLDEHVDLTDTRMRRVQKNLAILNKRMKSNCTCMSMLLSAMAMVILFVIGYFLIKFL